MGALRHRLVFIDGEPRCAIGSSTNGKQNDDKDDAVALAVFKEKQTEQQGAFLTLGHAALCGRPQMRRPHSPLGIDAPMNRDIFETYIETQLVPVLKPGDVVILDNLSSHKSERAAQTIQARGA